ncbi:MAG: GNAT family N-acetyltransferase, partial [Methanoregulaceae archaeon]|nr:GNAT family N-acetyltransferase [Methanoregulaceae archaeon]
GVRSLGGYADIFLNHEPMTRCYRISPDQFIPLAQVYVSLCAGDYLSFIARDPGSGELVGFIFCSDLSTDWSSRDPCMARLYSLFPGIASVLGSLEHRYGEQYPSGPGESLHIFQVGTSPRFQARGVAKALVSTAVNHARTRGFSYALAECTSPASRGLFSSCGFLVAYEQPFRNVSCGMSSCFADLPGSITLMVRKL